MPHPKSERPWAALRVADVDIGLGLRGEILSRGTARGSWGVDAVAARAGDGTPLLPDTHVLGKVRDTLTRLADDTGAPAPLPGTDEIGALFGPQVRAVERRDEEADRIEPASDTDEQDVPPAGFDAARRCVDFTDFTATTPDQADATRTRIAIDRRSKRAQDGSLLVMETPYGPGAPVEFRGTASVLCRGDQTAQRWLELIGIGLRCTPQFGAHRTIGMGRLRSVEVGHATTRSPRPSKDPLPDVDDHGLVGVRLRPRGRLCFPERSVAANLFVGATAIPGGAIKGALAGLIEIGAGRSVDGLAAELDERAPALLRWFDQIRFTHALPEGPAGARPQVPPLSLVKSVRGCLYDVALAGDEPLPIDGDAPAFDADWKTDDDVREAFGWPPLTRDLRLHTAIDARYRRHASGLLYAEDAVLPHEGDWTAWVDLGDVPAADREEVLADLAELFSVDLRRLGKANAAAAVELSPADAVDRVAASTLEPQAGRIGGEAAPLWVVTLQTDALLLPPEALAPGITPEELTDAYGAAWSDLSCGDLELVSLFSREAPAGGPAFHNRFLRNTERFAQARDAERDGGYEPYILTRRGSVFVLRESTGGHETAAARVRRWFTHGLPLPDWARGRYHGPGCDDADDASYWRTVPFLRHNGFGEIAVNLDVHRERLPRDAMAALGRDGLV